MATLGGQLVDVTDICANAALMPSPLVSRDNVLGAIDKILDQGMEVVCIEGDEHVGKSTLLLLAAKRHSKQCAYLYIRPITTYTYHPSVIREELCNQLHWTLYGKGLLPESDTGDATLRQRVMEVRRKFSRERMPFYIIVDGLGELPTSDLGQLSELLALLPLGTPGFKFIFSGSGESLFVGPLKRLRVKSFPLHPFSYSETREYFDDINLSEPDIRDLYNTFKGIPGYLNAARRLLISGTPLEKLMEETELQDLFELEWGQIKGRADRILNAISLVAFAKHQISLAEIAEISALEIKELKSEFATLSFLSVNDTEGTVVFVSSSFARFAQIRLQGRESKSVESYTNHLLQAPYSRKSIELIPQYLSRGGPPERLLAYLSNAYFEASIREGRSLSFLRQHAELGTKLSVDERSSEAYRFAILQSVISELFSVSAAKSEIEALISLGDYSRATAVANGATLDEDRLLLLGAVARSRKNAGFDVEQALLELLANLCDSVSVGRLETEKSIAIAAELFSVLPEKAIKLVESSSENENRDFAITQLSISTLSSAPNSAVTDTADLFRDKVGDTRTRAAVAAMSFFMAPSSASDVLSEIARLSNPKDQVLLLRTWCKRHAKADNALDVVEFALDTALRSTALSVSAGFYRDIALPLPLAKDLKRVRNAIDIIDSQRAVLEKLGPLDELAKLELLLAEALFNCNQKSGVDRLVGSYLEFESSLKGPESQASFLAGLLSLLDRIDPSGSEFAKEGLRQLASDRLKTNIDSLLADSAAHEKVFADVLDYLSEGCPIQAIELTEKMNISPRRELSLSRVLQRIIGFQFDKPRFEIVRNTLATIESPRLRDNAVAAAITAACEKAIDDVFGETCGALVEMLPEISGAAVRARSAIKIIAHNSRFPKGVATQISTRAGEILETAWDSLDRPWLKLDIGFEAAAALAKSDIDMAKKYFDLTNTYKAQLPLQSEEAADILFHLILLAIRSFFGLIEAKVERGADAAEIDRMIEKIPGHGDKVTLFSRLAISYFRARRPEDAKKIVFQKIRPNIDAISTSNLVRKYDVTCVAAPALWLANSQTAEAMFDLMSPTHRDKAYARVCECLLKGGMSPEEPFDPNPGHVYKTDFDAATKVVDLTERIADDSIFNSKLSDLLAGVESVAKKGSISRDQVAFILDRVERRILPRLPALGFIQHEGYKILLEAHLQKLKHKKITIDAFLARTHAIGNKADSIFVLARLAELLPSKDAVKRLHILEEARILIASLPSKIDQITRLEMLAHTALSVDKIFSKQCVSEAFSICSKDDIDTDAHAARQRKSLIDFAYRIDSEFANSLASSMNDDPAKHIAHMESKRQIEVSNLVRGILNESKDLDLSDSNELTFANAAWRCAGVLNASAATPVHISRVYDVLKESSKYGLMSAYPGLAFLVEDLRLMYGGTQQASQYIRPYFDAVAKNIAFLDIALHAIARIPYFGQGVSSIEPRDGIVVGEGEEARALRYITDWFSAQSLDEIIITDPYFSPSDLYVLSAIRSSNSKVRITVLTSASQQKKSGVVKPYDDFYSDSWRSNISQTQDPPETLFVIANMDPDGSSPVHDRWVLTSKGGLRLGTSFNSLGKKVSDISLLSEQDALVHLQEVEPYVQQRKRRHQGKRVSYSSFSL